MNLVFFFLSFSTLILITIITSSAKADFSTRLVQMRTLDSILNPSRYDKRIRPNAVNESDPMDKPLVISFNIFVRDVQEVNIESKTMRMQINLRYEWTDARLKYDDINGKITYLNMINTSRIWTPDIFFPNELIASKHTIVTDNSLTRIYPDGRVYHASRYTLTLICANMKLNRYPLDKQVCPLQIAPWAFTKTELLFQFGVKEPKVGPIVMTKKVYSLPDYRLIGTDTANCTSHFLQSRYTCIEVLFTFQRTMYQPVTRLFCPTTLLLILSWIPFFLRGSPPEVEDNENENSPQKSSPPAVSKKRINGNRTTSFILSISSLFAMVWLISQISAKGPRIDTINAGDIWTGVCLTLSFISFLNVVIIEILERKNAPNDVEADTDPWSNQWQKTSINRRRSLNHVHFEKKSEVVIIEPKDDESKEGAKEEKKGEEGDKKDVVVAKTKPLAVSSSDHGQGIGIEKMKSYVLSNQVRCAVILGQFLHPAMFILFNLIYWTCLSRGANVASSSSS